MTKIFNQLEKYNFLEKLLINIGLFLGVLSLTLYFFGLVSLFYRPIVIIITVIYFLLFLFVLRKINLWADFKIFKLNFRKTIKQDKWLLAIIIIFFLFVSMNFIVALAPETGFDALWYHLTLPKIYLLSHQIRFIHGGNLYYSVMPREIEMLYASALAFNPSGILPKLIHLIFGLFWFTGTYTLARLYLSRRNSMFAALIIFGTTLVSWLSQTAYIDLGVAFFVVMTIWLFLKYQKTQEKIDIYLASIFMGFALSAKIVELFLFIVIIIIFMFKKDWKNTAIFCVIAIFIALPFYLQAYFTTGHIIYPTTSFIDSNFNAKNWYIFTWWKLLPKSIYQLFVFTYTPILVVVPLIFLAKNWQKMILPIIILSGFIILYSISPFQDSRYFLVILPIIALLISYIIENINFKIGKYLLITLAIIFMFHNFYNSLNGFKGNIKVVLGLQTRNQYLCTHTAPAFYDCNGFLDKYTLSNDKIWTANIGLRFYLNRPFADFDYDPNWRDHLSSAKTFHNYLVDNNFKYILFGNGTTLTQFTEIDDKELNQYFQLLYEDNFYKLYKIK